MKQKPEDARSPYLVVADDLRAAISSGRYQPGEKIPSIAQLADDYDVVASTIQAALRLLKTEGILEGRQGAGTFVAVATPPASLVDALQEALETNQSHFKYTGPITGADRETLGVAFQRPLPEN